MQLEEPGPGPVFTYSPLVVEMRCVPELDQARLDQKFDFLKKAIIPYGKHGIMAKYVWGEGGGGGFLGILPIHHNIFLNNFGKC